MMDAYAADSSLKGKLRRRLVRLACRRPARVVLQRPMITFGFDDAPASSVAGAAILEARGLRGTWFICAGICGDTGPMGPNTTLDQVRSLAAAGHEIACHTHSHLDCGQADETAIEADLAANAAALAALGLPAPQTFAYPYGDVSLAAKKAASARFFLSRGLHHGVVETGADLNQAPAVGIEGVHGEAMARHWLRQARARPAWLMLYTHDVGPSPSAWGCTPGALERLADLALAEGFEVVTTAEGAARVGGAVVDGKAA